MLKRYNKMLINTYLLENYEWGVTIGKGINLIARKMLTITLFLLEHHFR